MYSNLSVSSLLKLDKLEQCLIFGATALHKAADVADMAHKSLHNFNNALDNLQLPVFPLYSHEYIEFHDDHSLYHLNNTFLTD